MLRYFQKKSFFSGIMLKKWMRLRFLIPAFFKKPPLWYFPWLNMTFLFDIDFSFEVLTFSFSFYQILHFIYPWWLWWRWCYILSKTFSVYFETEWFMRSGLNGAIVKISVSNVKTSYNPNITFQNCCSLIIQENCPFLWRLLFDMNARTLSPYLTKPPDSLSSPRAESARAFTGRRCPHNGKGEDFLIFDVSRIFLQKQL